MNMERGFDEQGLLGSIQQPGASTGSAPEHTVQPLSRPDSEQLQDVQDREWYIFWIEPP